MPPYLRGAPEQSAPRLEGCCSSPAIHACNWRGLFEGPDVAVIDIARPEDAHRCIAQAVALRVAIGSPAIVIRSPSDHGSGLGEFEVVLAFFGPNEEASSPHHNPARE